MAIAIIILATIMFALGAILPFFKGDESCKPEPHNPGEDCP